MLNNHELNSLQQSDLIALSNSNSFLSSDYSSIIDEKLFDLQNTSGSSAYWHEDSLFDEYLSLNTWDSNSNQNIDNNVLGQNNSDNHAFKSNTLIANNDIAGFSNNWQDVALRAYDEITGERIDNDLYTGNSLSNKYQDDTQSNNYSSSLSAAASTVNYIPGNLRANTFTVQAGFARTVISGNGNVDFSSGYRDTLDLSNFSSNSVGFDLANSSSGGVAYNPGNGTRIFDAINFSNGSQILFEGIDTIRFADGNVNLSITPNDPYFNQQWNLHMMGVHNAWRFTTGSNQVMVGVQDTGIGVNSSGYIHPDLKMPYHISTNLREDYSSSQDSHGTSVQGIIAAKSNNGLGMSGINWNSDVFSIDVLGGNQGDTDLVAATQAMINSANQKGQRLVINMSLSGSYSPILEKLIADNQSQALFVISSGNGSDNGGDSKLAHPAILANKYNNVMAIGASWGTQDTNGYATTPGKRISYSGLWGSNYGYGLTLMAPSEVITTEAVNTTSGSQFDYSVKFNGTSAAAPNASGVASLVWSVNPYLNAAQVNQIMSQTAYDLGYSGYDYEFGHGFINADAAVRRALATSRGYA